MDPITLATAAVAALTPLLGAGATEVAKTASKDLYGWLKGKLVGRAADALGDLEKAPDSVDNQADLRKQLTKLLEAEPALAAELRALLPGNAAGAVSQTIVQTGSNNIGGQADRGSTVKIQR